MTGLNQHNSYKIHVPWNAGGIQVVDYQSRNGKKRKSERLPLFEIRTPAFLLTFFRGLTP
jgi:hypothetical protein